MVYLAEMPFFRLRRTRNDAGFSWDSDDQKLLALLALSLVPTGNAGAANCCE
jgi:hypothetical protein